MTRRIVRLSSCAVLTLALLVPHRAFGAEPAQAPASTADPFTPTLPPAEQGEVHMGATAPATVSTEPSAVARDESASANSGSPGSPRVRIESSGDRPVTLYEISAGFVGSSGDGAVSGVLYRPVCTGTCDVVVDGSRGNEFFVGGTGVTASKPFTLAGDSGELTLVVRPGRPAASIIGFVATIIGGCTLAASIPLASSRIMRERAPGAIATIAVSSAVLTAVGIPLLLRGRTKVAKRRW